jgi:hypothetical protein
MVCRREFLVGVSALALMMGHAEARRLPRGSTAPPSGFSEIQFGGGGFVVSFDYSTVSSPKLIGTDTGGDGSSTHGHELGMIADQAASNADFAFRR